jgi:hypothetical protein
VKWIHKVGATLLLAFWLPATMCCALERAEVPFFQYCCQDDTSQGAPQAPRTEKSCCVLEEGGYGIQNPASAHVVPVMLLTLSLANFVERSPPLPIVSDSAPLNLQAAWQFSIRTALPSRAPPLLS